MFRPKPLEVSELFWSSESVESIVVAVVWAHSFIEQAAAELARAASSSMKSCSLSLSLSP